MTTIRRSSRSSSSPHRHAFHHRLAYVWTGCFLVAIALVSLASRRHVLSNNNYDDNEARFLADSTDYTTYSCNQLFDVIPQNNDNVKTNQCEFAKNCNQGEGIFLGRLLFCSKKGSYQLWAGLLSPFLLLWLILLFRMLGSTAEDYFSPSLEMFSLQLGLPPRFAGVSLLALGNGAADVSATVNAITADPTHGYRLALGALTGAAMFIGTVVAGSVILVQDGVPCRGALVRDVAALGLAAVMVAATLRAGTVGPAHISVFVAVYLVFVAIVLVADVYHRTVVLPRLERLRREREVQRQQALSQQLQQRAGDDLNQLAELETTAETTPNILSTILTSISNYDNTTTTNNNNNDTTQDGWGVESDDVIHERPVVLHGANGILTPTKQRTQDQLDDNDLNPSVGNYTILTDGMDHICTQHGFSAHNWKGAWNDGMYELEMELHDVWKDCKDDDQPLYEKILLVCEFPFTVLRKLTVPIPCEGYYVRAVVATSTVLSSIWCAFYLWNQHDMNIVFHKPPMFVIQFVLCFVVGALILRYAPGGGDGVLNLKIATPLALYGFMVAATWIDWIANHLVQLLDLLGIVCGIPGSVMGLTILAWGNSMSDLTANLTMARKGLANMAMTACYAGPVFNILIGLSFGFSSLAAQTGNPITHVSMNPSIVTGFAFLVINAVGLLVVGVVLNPGRIPKAYGYGMLLLYMIYVVLSVVLQFSKNGSS